jgi:hypothetical protein
MTAVQNNNVKEHVLRVRSVGRRALVALGLTGAMAATVIVGAANASASTIPNGHIQICAQGTYPTFLHVLLAPSNSGDAGPFESFVVFPNQGSNSCWWNETPISTNGQWVQVDVVGFRANGAEFYIGSKWWNSDYGLGIGAEGSESAPWIQTW